jgi:hypothetical protein
VAVVLSALGSFVNGSRASLNKARYMTAWGIMPLDRGQPGRVLPSLPKTARIAYYDDLSFYFYASKGGLAHGAVFGPAVAGTAKEASYYGADSRLALSVRARDGFYGYVGLRRGKPIVIRASRPIDWSTARLNLSPRSASSAFDLHLIRDAKSAPVLLPVKALKPGWHTLGLPAGTKGTALVVTRRDQGPLAWIQGVRIAVDAKTAWPWDAGVTIVQSKLTTDVAQLVERLRKGEPAAKKDEKATLHRFETTMLTPPGCRHRGIVADFGATVVSRIECGAAPAAQPAKRPVKSRRRRRR